MPAASPPADPSVPAGAASGLPEDELAAEAGRLVDVAARAVEPTGGFGWLDDDLRRDPGQPVTTWITARMTHVFALAALEGRPGAAELVDHGIAALAGPLRDADNGGWYAAVPSGGLLAEGGRKDAYPHMFVVLAAASATVAGRPGAADLLGDVLGVVRERFWDDAEGLCVESWDRTWTELDDYRGANANMHAVEAFLAAADATGDGWWRLAALRIVERLVHGSARAHGWRLPEHYDAQWRPLMGYNVDAPADPFRPFGATIGHGLEWSRLLLHVEAALEAPPAWLREDSREMFAASVRDGWNVDEADGFVYTVDWDGAPVVRERMHWVLAEGIAAAAALASATGEPSYAAAAAAWWQWAGAHLLDRERGSWHSELGPDNRPSATVWRGKPDIYHAFQATLVSRLPLAPMFAAAVRDRAAAGAPPLIAPPAG